VVRGNPAIPRRGTPFAAVLALLLALAAASSAHAASAFVPLDHPAYGAVAGWLARGVLPPTSLTARPYTWERLAAMLDAASPATDSDRARVAALRAEAGSHLERPLRGEVAVTGAVVEGHPVLYKNLPADSGGPLGANDAGVAYGETVGADLRVRLEGRAGARLAAVLEPRAALGDVGGGNPGWQEGYLAADLGPLAVVAGRQPFAWGPAPDGGFLLTPNAAPLPALRLGLVEPHTFSGGWSWLGTVDFMYLLARLGDDRVVPHPLLTGLRLVWMPSPRLELGASRTILFGGEGQPGLSAADYLVILSGRNLSGASDTSNSIAGVDATARLPVAGGRGLTLYAEYAGEDESIHLPTKPAVRVGAALSGLGTGHRYSLRAEYAATDVFYDHQHWGHNVWYGHSVYGSGYSYRGRILGDPMGSDARTARVGLARDGTRSHAELTLGWFATRFSDPEREDHWQGGARWSRSDTAHLGVTVDARLERVTYDDARPAAWQSLLLGVVSYTR
jgi:hypothetical protein